MAQTAGIAVQNALAFRKLREADAALQRADHRKNEFLAMLAHELRNPLAPITNSLEILRLMGDTAGPAGAARGVLERQVRHMVRLIDDLLDVNRITHNKLDLRLERIEFRTVLEAAVETAAPLLHGAGRDFSVSLPPEPCWLDGDLARLAQVFTNLLSNAAKYTRPGDRIWVAAERHDSEVVVTVGDTGVGIAPEDRTRVFDLFVQAGERTRESGSGLGSASPWPAGWWSCMAAGSMWRAGDGDGAASLPFACRRRRRDRQGEAGGDLAHPGTGRMDHQRARAGRGGRPHRNRQSRGGGAAGGHRVGESSGDPARLTGNRHIHPADKVPHPGDRQLHAGLCALDHRCNGRNDGDRDGAGRGSSAVAGAATRGQAESARSRPGHAGFCEWLR